MKNNSKIIRIIIMLAVIISVLVNGIEQVYAKGNVRVYETSAYGVRKFSKKGDKLTVKINKINEYSLPFTVRDKNGDIITEKGGWSKNFKLTKKCQWIKAHEPTEHFYNRNKIDKISYKKMKKDYDNYWNDEYVGDWDYGILIFTKDGKAYKVVSLYS